MRFYSLLFFLLMITFSCSKSTELGDGCGSRNANAINIRIENVSQFDFTEFKFDPYNEQINFGTIDKGALTCYEPFERAYDYGFFNFYANGKEFRLQPIDYVGEEILKKGNYTYQMDIVDFDKRMVRFYLKTD